LIQASPFAFMFELTLMEAMLILDYIGHHRS